MIKLNHWNSLELSALEVGDKVGYMGHYCRERHDAKEVEVVRVTATRVVIKSKLTDGREVEHAFMKSTGREVGTTSTWRSACLITLDSVNKSKAENETQKVFQEKMNQIAGLVKNY